MKRKSRLTLPVGVLSALALIVGVYLFTRPAPIETESASSMREYLQERTQPQAPAEPQAPQTVESEVAALLQERQKLDETVWAKEVAAQKREQTIVKYWDRMLRPEDDKYAVLADFPFQTITLDAPGDTTELDWGIRQTVFGGKWKTLDQTGWRKFLHDMENRGYVIEAIEFHQSSFEMNDEEDAVSVFNVLLNVTNKNDSHRWTVNSKLRVEWTAEQDNEGLYMPRALTLYDTKLLEREGSPVFDHRVIKPEIRSSSYPIVYDLNKDGYSDILLPVQNSVLWNRGDGQFDEETLVSVPGLERPKLVQAAVAADFTGDGHVDLLYSGEYKDSPLPLASCPHETLRIRLPNHRGRNRDSMARRDNDNIERPRNQQVPSGHSVELDLQEPRRPHPRPA